MASVIRGLWLAALFLSLADGHAINRNAPASGNHTSPVPLALQRRDVDPADFGWIKRWAAIGDSFTAGIGSGQQLGKVWHDIDDWICSRYDQAYPMVLNEAFGPAVQSFQYPACSGDRSEGIYKQAQTVQGDLDLVIMTAGGNDLCLASMIKKCIFLPFDGESTCQEVIDKAQENIDTILKPNLKSILLALNDKMADNSVVVYNGYAQFFNTDDDATCTEKQYWAWSKLNPKWWFSSALKLDVARRKRFNDLVIGINNAIKDVITDVQANGNVKYKVGFSNWDPWPYQGVRGQYCDPQGQGYYPDPDNQPDLHFFKKNTHLDPQHDELRRRGLSIEEMTPEDMQAFKKEHEKELRDDFYNSLLWKSPDPRAVALHRLSPRDTPAPPDCPGDKDFDPTLGIGLPDTFGKNFHPNELGHRTIAAFAMDRMIKLRAEVLGEDPSCKKFDEFHCWKKEGSTGYVTVDRIDENYQDFCNNKVSQPEHEVGWEATQTYHEGTPDEHTFSLQLSKNAADYNKQECLDSFKRIIHGCDGDDPENPMNWKSGGMWIRGEYTYRINIKRTNRPWPPPKEAHGDCGSQYKLVLSSFFLHGGGWSSWDYGQDSLKKSVGSCIGSTPSSWKFWYYDEPDKDGNEWSASFNTPIWVRARCFSNNKAQGGAGGKTSGCSGSG